MKDRDNDTLPELWKQTRSGAWSVRGLHYQHLFSTLILIYQWAGLAPTGYLVPEGQEDCVIELPDRNIWIQIKSKKSGAFSKGKLEEISAHIKQKADRTSNQKPAQVAVGLEQPCTGVPEREIDKLFEGEDGVTVVCKEPEREIVSLLSQKLSVLDEIAEVLARNLCWLVAESAAENASRTFENRRRISTTEIDQRIHRYLEASDPSAITHAFESGALAPVDFVTPVHEPSFYRGVKVRPGHLAAGLVLERPTETRAIVDYLKHHRHLLITGVSGSGKSALLWLAANRLNAEMRWYHITDRAAANHAASIIRSIQAGRPNQLSPIGLAFDEVGPSNIDLWSILANELRELPDVYLLGTVRNEDKPLVALQPDTGFFEAFLSENLAESLWQELTCQGQTEWQHWFEPFELSNGLLLEYVHVLTQGKRLAAVIGEQVRQRQQKNRYDELAIIRATSALSLLGGEIEASKLFRMLELPPDRGHAALQRLLDEHLVSESRPGVLGGLHALRSQALNQASHDEIVYLRTDTLWRVVLATTNETLPKVVHSVLRETPPENEGRVVQLLAELLATSDDIELWTAVLTGLGLGTLERRVVSFITILDEHRVPRAFWSAASLFALTDANMPETTMPAVRNAVFAFKTVSHRDLRADCIDSLPQTVESPICRDIRQANRFLSCFVSLTGGDSLPVPFIPNIASDSGQEMREIATLLSTAYAVAPELGRNLASKWGDEQKLLDRYHAQTAWMTAPVVEPNGVRGRTIRANLLYIDEEHQADPHKTIDDICETLLAISRQSDAAASEVIDPSGQPVQMGGFKFLSRNIQRHDIPAKAQVAWNVAFRQILLERAVTVNLTDYAQTMAHLIRRTEKAFGTFAEQWLKNKGFSDNLCSNIKQIAFETSRFANPSRELPSYTMATLVDGAEYEEDIGSLLANVLDNIVPRLKKVPVSDNTIFASAKTVASFADSRSVKIREHIESDIWRKTSSPPRARLLALASRLDDVASILHEVGYRARNGPIPGKVGILDNLSGKSVRAAARICRQSAKHRLSLKLRSLKKGLRAKGWSATFWTRATDKSKSAYWPAVEIAVLVEIEGFDTDGGYLDDCLSIGQELLSDDWRFCVAPVINGHVLPEFAFTTSMMGPLLEIDFASEWKEHIDLPFLTAELAPNSDAFDKAVGSCHQISAIILSRDLENLFPEEDIVLAKAVERYNRNRGIIDAFAEESGFDEFLLAAEHLNEVGKQVLGEYQAAQNGQEIEDPLCMNPFSAIAGEENEESIEFGLMRMLLRQVECKHLTS